MKKEINEGPYGDGVLTTMMITLIMLMRGCYAYRLCAPAPRCPMVFSPVEVMRHGGNDDYDDEGGDEDDDGDAGHGDENRHHDVNEQ